MNIVIIEKKVKIGEVGNQSIYAWEFFDAVQLTNVKRWCAERGFIIPKFGVTPYVELETYFRCQLFEV